MPWVTPKTFVAGAVLPASDLNTHLRDQLLVLRGGGIELPDQDSDSWIASSSPTQFAVRGSGDVKLWSEVFG